MKFFIVFVTLTVAVSCGPLPEVDVTGISENLIASELLYKQDGQGNNQIIIFEDVIKLLETGLSNIQADKREFNVILNHVKDFSDKDLSKWISKTGLGLFDEIVKRKQENNKYYSAVLLWIQKRQSFSGEINQIPWRHKLTQLECIIQQTLQSLYKQISSISGDIETIASLSLEDIDDVKGYLKDIQDQINDDRIANQVIHLATHVLTGMQANQERNEIDRNRISKQTRHDTSVSSHHSNHRNDHYAEVAGQVFYGALNGVMDVVADGDPFYYYSRGRHSGEDTCCSLIVEVCVVGLIELCKELCK